MSKRKQQQQQQQQEKRTGGGTFEVLGLEKDRAYVILLNQGPDLIGDGGALKAHHKQLAELSVIYKGQLSMRSSQLGGVVNGGILVL